MERTPQEKRTFVTATMFPSRPEHVRQPLHVVAEIGGTNMVIASRTHLNRPVRYTVTKGSQKEFEVDIKLLEFGIEDLQAQYGKPVASITLSLAGLLNADQSGLAYAGNLTHWVDQPVKVLLRSHFGCPVLIVNDAQAAAYAEATDGHGVGRSFWQVIWGTGVGACYVHMHNGEPIAIAGEGGHSLLPTRQPNALCGCGQANCAEAHLGGDRLLDRCGVRNFDDISRIQELEICIDMAAFIRNIATVHPTQLVLFSGTVAAEHPGWLAEVSRILQHELRIPEPKLKLAKFDKGAGMHGLKQYSLRTFGAPA